MTRGGDAAQGELPEGPGPLVLVVEDDPVIAKFLRAALGNRGFGVVTAASGMEALMQATSHNPDLVLLDLKLPDVDGFSVLSRLREWYRAPVLIVSASERQGDKVAALEAGANDYVTKPFAVGELVARMRVWLRQAAIAGGGLPTSLHQIGELRFDFGRGLVFLGEEELRFTRTEYKLLGFFVKNAGKVLSHEQILEHVWGPRHRQSAQYVRVYVGHLRRKIERDPTRPRYLVTEAGIGYRLKGE
jgi:two-component system KDP operon response regulator KdpE